MEQTTLDLFTTSLTSLAVIINAVALIFVVKQVKLMKADLKSQGHIEMVARWNTISELELANPDLHRLLMTKEAKVATSSYSNVELKKRAFLHMVFDVLSQREAVLSEIGNRDEKHQYLYSLMENEEVRMLWKEGEIRSAFADDPFQAHADKAYEVMSKTFED